MAADAGADRMTALPGDWDVPVITAHVRDAIVAAPVLTDPFPHLVIEPLLPARAFGALLEAVPAESFFDGEDPRHRDLKGPGRADLPPFAKAIWGSMSSDIVAGVMGPAIAERLRPLAKDYLRVSVGDEFVDEAVALELETRGLRLMLRRPGWSLAPHLDPRDQFITTLLYLARPGDPEQYGTQLFRVHRENFVASWANTYYPEAEGLRCELAKTLPFRGNVCVSFLNLGGGAHAAELPADAQPPDLKRYAFQFYMGPDRGALEALVSRLSPERQVAWTRRVKKKDRKKLQKG